MKWSEEEDRALLRLIQKTGNIRRACQIHAKKHNRVAGSVRAHVKYNIKKGKFPQDLSRQKRKWSKEEIKALLNLVKKHPHNFNEAYRIHAENTGRTLVAVQTFFLEYRKKEDAKVCMMTIGGSKMISPNRKNIYSKTGGEVKTIKASKWRKILAILFG